MGKMLKNEVAKNELKEVRHSEEWHKSGEKVKYRLATISNRLLRIRLLQLLPVT